MTVTGGRQARHVTVPFNTNAMVALSGCMPWHGGISKPDKYAFAQSFYKIRRRGMQDLRELAENIIGQRTVADYSGSTVGASAAARDSESQRSK